MAVKTSISLDTVLKAPPLNGFICNAFGKPNAKGKYFCWPIGAQTTLKSTDEILAVVGNNINAERCYIVKLVTPYTREKTVDLKKYLDNPVDLSDKKVSRRINRKIQIVLNRLGVAFADRAGTVTASNKIACSSWYTHGHKEGISINPHIILKNDMGFLMRIIKKETIHRALFRNLFELSNKRILNFTLDVLAMRCIAQTPYNKLDKQTVKLAEKLFTTKLYKEMPFLALLDCSITEKQVKSNLPPAYAEIWLELYGQDQYGFLPPLKNIKPSALYFKIKALINDLQLDGAEKGKKGFMYPWSTLASNNITTDGGEQQNHRNENIPVSSTQQSASLENGVKKQFVPKHKRYGLGFSNEFSDFWEENVVQKESFITKELAEFAKKWRTKNLLENAEAKLVNRISNENVKIELYPENQTDDSILFSICGITPNLIPFFWNKVDGQKANRKRIAAFFDVSPSTQPFWPYMVHIMERIEEDCDVQFTRNTEHGIEEGAYTFAGSVKSLSKDEVNEMKKGKMPGGASTSFESVLNEVLARIETDKIDIILCFTDGESSASEEKIKKFNETGKTFHRIYFNINYKEGGQTREITSDLDKLNGDSITLNLPPADSEI